MTVQTTNRLTTLSAVRNVTRSAGSMCSVGVPMRNRRSSTILAAALAIAAPLTAISAQVVHTRTGTAAGAVAAPAAAAPARIAGIAPAPPTIVIVAGDERFFNQVGNQRVI